MLCKECGAMNKDGALFCSQCGNLLNKEEVEEHKEEIINESHEDPIEEVKEEYVQNEDVKECEEEIIDEPEQVQEEKIIVEPEQVQEEIKEDQRVYCQYCGEKIYPSALICPHCGSSTGKTIPVTLMIEDKNNIGLNVLSLFSPLFGIFGYLIFKDKLPKMTKSMRNFAIIGIACLCAFFFLLGVTSELGKETCQYSEQGTRCQEEVYQDGYCQYHYFMTQNPFFQNF